MNYAEYFSRILKTSKKKKNMKKIKGTLPYLS